MRIVAAHTEQGCLPPEVVAQVVGQSLSEASLDGQRVLVLIPDGTRTIDLPVLVDAITAALDGAAALDFLVALGTHAPLSDQQLSRLVGRPVANQQSGRVRVMNHRWDEAATFVTLGTIEAEEVAELTSGRLRHAVPVSLNRLILDYDHVVICGPVFPHEVVGFSGGNKYLFPGIAGSEIINFTHWLGALIGSVDVIGTRDTPVRAVIDRAARFVPTPVSLIAAVASPEGFAGVFCGPVADAWAAAAALSARRHVVWLDRPVQRVLSIMPPMYEDLWTAAKGMYKVEPVVADGGEVVILAPHLTEISRVHGRLLEEIGYHCRDYFLAQWDRFKHYPGGVLAHSTHVKGQGSYDARTGAETPRISVRLATGIPAERCARVNLSYADPASIDLEAWQAEAGDDVLVVPRAGEMLYRVGRPAA